MCSVAGEGEQGAMQESTVRGNGVVNSGGSDRLALVVGVVWR